MKIIVTVGNAVLEKKVKKDQELDIKKIILPVRYNSELPSSLSGYKTNQRLIALSNLTQVVQMLKLEDQFFHDLENLSEGRVKNITESFSAMLSRVVSDCTIKHYPSNSRFYKEQNADLDPGSCLVIIKWLNWWCKDSLNGHNPVITLQPLKVVS